MCLINLLYKSGVIISCAY